MGTRPTGDSGAVVLGWLTKLAVTLTALGLLGFDALSLGMANLAAGDDARAAARSAAQTFAESRNAQLAYDAALAEVAGDGSLVDAPSFQLAPDGVVTLTVRSEATTLVLHRVERFDRWRSISTTATGRPSG